MVRTSQLLLEPYYEYLNFIGLCRNKEYEDGIVLHKHHIIPRCLGGSNSKKNLVKLSVEDHIISHLLLGNCFDSGSYEQISNYRSARLLNKKSIKDQETLEKIKETYIGKNNPFYGKTHSQETRLKISEATKRNRSGVSYETLYGELRCDEQKAIRSKSTKAVWDNRSDAEKTRIINKMKKGLKGKPAWNKGIGKKVQIDSLIFESITEAAKHFNTSKFILLKTYDVIFL